MTVNDSTTSTTSKCIGAKNSAENEKCWIFSTKIALFRSKRPKIWRSAEIFVPLHCDSRETRQDADSEKANR